MNTLESVRKAPTNKTMGIEIECCARKSFPGSWSGFFYCGSDGSISTTGWSDHGYEFVSQPLTHEWMHRELRKLYKTFKTLDVYTNNSCGIHVHVSKKWCTDKKAAAIWAFIKSISEVDFEDLFGRLPNSYCTKREVRWQERYRSINTTNTHTNEFRMFASSADERWAHYCIDCVKYMVDNAYTLNISAFSAFRDQPKYRGII